MIELRDDQLVIRFPKVHREAVCRVEFQRTLRIPDDNRSYPLPPGLGRFPLTHVDDYRDRVPASWVEHGGVFLPMYQTEALWLNFDGDYPFALKIAAGKVNAVSGEPWTNALTAEPQDYVVVPEQPWLDGFSVSKGIIRQFVAMPLGEGYTAEEQLTGKAEHGGVQILACPMKKDVYEELQRQRARERMYAPVCASEAVPSMGLAPGGLMRQEVYADPYGIEAWDQTVRSRCFIHIVNSLQYLALTGTQPPTEPPTAQQYAQAGLPWFDYFDAELTALDGAAKLAGLDSVAAKHLKKQLGAFAGNEPVAPFKVQQLTRRRSRIREGRF